MDAVIYNKIEQEANRIINAYVGNITPGAKVGLYTPTEDLNTLTISHDFGTVPKLAYLIAAPNNTWMGMSNNTIMYVILGSSPENGDFNIEYISAQKIDYVVSIDNVSAGTTAYKVTNSWTTYPASMTTTNVTFATGRYYNGKFKAGVTYIYVIIK